MDLMPAAQTFATAAAEGMFDPGIHQNVDGSSYERCVDPAALRVGLSRSTWRTSSWERSHFLSLGRAAFATLGHRYFSPSFLRSTDRVHPAHEDCGCQFGPTGLLQ